MNQPILEPILPSNPLVYLDINFGQEYMGRLVIELRKDIVPKTAENFRALCTGERGVGSLGKPLHYKGIRFHKVTRLFVAQSGDVVNNDGTCGESIYGPTFEDESFYLPHEEGVVSMANYGKPDTNNSEFVITSVPCDNLNGTNVVVGKVLRGLGIIGDMELHTNDEGQPTKEIVIAGCGEIPAGVVDWGHCDSDEAGYRLPPYPQDWPGKTKPFTADEIDELLTTIRNAGNKYFADQRYTDARRKYRKAQRYYVLLRTRHNWHELCHLQSADDCLEGLDSFGVLNAINMAAVEIKLHEYENAMGACTEAIRLDGKCSKAYYRRARAEIALKNYEHAIDDLRRARELLPENKQIVSELKRTKQLLAEYNRGQMKALKNLFN